jgi:hypothetical protein
MQRGFIMNTRSKSDDFAWLFALWELKEASRKEEQVIDKVCVTRISVLKLNLPLALPFDGNAETAVLFDGLCIGPSTRWSVYVLDPDLVDDIKATLLGSRRRHRAVLLRFNAKKVMHCNRIEPSRVPSMAAIATSFTVLHPAEGSRP